MNTGPTYHPELAQNPFYLGRHGESIGNAGTMAQGRGEDRSGQPNGLTPEGIRQVEAAVPALAAAGFNVCYVSSSALTRAVESATTFVDASADPKPILVGKVAPDAEHGLKEISQQGWEHTYDREQRALLYQKKLTRFMGKLALTSRLTLEDIDGYAAWVMQLGDKGESPLGGGLRGILALEEHGLKPGELVFSHAMLNRYMDAIATVIDDEDRGRLRNLLDERSTPGTISSIAIIKTLKESGVKGFKTYEHTANKLDNGGAIEYTVGSSGLWTAGRRIEPPKSGDNHQYIEYQRNGEAAQWKRVTPGGDNGGDNE